MTIRLAADASVLLTDLANDLLISSPASEREPMAAAFGARLKGTSSDKRGTETRRCYVALDWMFRTRAPAWLGLVPELNDDVWRLRSLSPVTDVRSFDVALATMIGARERAGAAWSRPPPYPVRPPWAELWALLTGPSGDFATPAAMRAASALESHACVVFEPGAVVWRVAKWAAEAARGSAAAAAACMLLDDAVRDAAKTCARLAASTATRHAEANVAVAALSPTALQVRASTLDLFARMCTITDPA